MVKSQRWSRILTTFPTRQQRRMPSTNNKGSLTHVVSKVRSTLPDSSWEDLWKEGVTPWDLGKPTPLLIHELERASICLKSESVIRKFRSLVPGCGGGYDLLTLQKHQTNHFKNYSGPSCGPAQSVVVGLDLSSTALSRAMKTVTSDGNFDDITRIDLVCGDFFDDPSNWSKLYSSNTNVQISQPLVQYDFIFDYTFFCALKPHFRDQWGAQMAKLLEPMTGLLLTFIFPIMPSADAMHGPPYPVSIDDYVAALEPQGIKMKGEPFQSPWTVPSRLGQEMVCYWTLKKA